MLDFLGSLQRTHTCGELRAEHAGQHVVLMGWVNRRRDHGNLIFLDLRDRTGITQVVLDKEVLRPTAHAQGRTRAAGVCGRGEGHRCAGAMRASINPKMPTGEIEVVANELLLLNESRTPPFSPAEDVDRERRRAAEVSLSRSAPAADAAQHRSAASTSRLRFATTFRRRDFWRSRRRS